MIISVLFSKRTEGLLVRYGIYSGWFATPEARTYKVYGSDFMRSVDCYYLWEYCIKKYSHPATTLIIDQKSPLKPEFGEEVTHVEMVQNFGHAVGNRNTYCGMVRTIFMGLMHAFCNDLDYAIYVEQGCLLYGHNIIENIVADNSSSGIIIPSGRGTPQPVQTSFFCIRRDYIIEFLREYTKIPLPDNRMSPEKKIHAICQRLPSAIVDLGVGRARPINFSADRFFVKHCTELELKAFCNLVGYDLERRPEAVV
jgi:hypothetical protein